VAPIPVVSALDRGLESMWVVSAPDQLAAGMPVVSAPGLAACQAVEHLR